MSGRKTYAPRSVSCFPVALPALALVPVLLIACRERPQPAKAAPAATARVAPAATVRAAPPAASGCPRDDAPRAFPSIDCSTEVFRIELTVDRCDGRPRAVTLNDSYGSASWYVSQGPGYEDIAGTLEVTRLERPDAHPDPAGHAGGPRRWRFKLGYDSAVREQDYGRNAHPGFMVIDSTEWRCTHPLEGRYRIVRFASLNDDDDLEVLFDLRCPPSGERVTGCVHMDLGGVAESARAAREGTVARKAEEAGPVVSGVDALRREQRRSKPVAQTP